MQHQELDLEKQCRAEARKRGWAAWKNEKNGNKGIPDDSFLSPDGERFVMVEFKKDAKQHLRPEQEVWQARYPHIIHVVSDLRQFLEIIEG